MASKGTKRKVASESEDSEGTVLSCEPQSAWEREEHTFYMHQHRKNIAVGNWFDTEKKNPKPDDDLEEGVENDYWLKLQEREIF